MHAEKQSNNDTVYGRSQKRSYLIPVLTMRRLPLLATCSYSFIYAAQPEGDDIQSYTERTIYHNGSHTIKMNGQVIGTLYDYVYGVYSQADGYAMITNIIPSAGSSYTLFMVPVYTGSDDYGFIYVSNGDRIIMSIEYTLHTNGYLEENISYL